MQPHVKLTGPNGEVREFEVERAEVFARDFSFEIPTEWVMHSGEGISIEYTYEIDLNS